MDIERVMGQSKDVKPGIYILVDDGSDEFDDTLVFASRMARANGARLGIVHILEQRDFMHWGGIASLMDKEVREDAERRLWQSAQRVNEESDLLPALFLEEGDPKEIIPRICGKYRTIKRLILGANTSSSGPGPLVSYFTGKGISSLCIPITIVPDHIDIDEFLNRS